MTKTITKNQEKKRVVIDEIKAKLDKAASVVLVDGRGLTVYQDTELRKKLRESEVDYKVYKNTMMELAIKETPFEGLSDYLKGPTAVAISYADATAAARVISKELKGLPKLEFKAGVVEGTAYDAKGIRAIAEIPPRAELLSRLLGSFKSPMASLARVINQIAEKQAGGTAEPVSETVPESVAETAAEPVTE
ncbi:MAG: 50S ribosomal protein L10 [Clostridiales bacterium]|nr:50S ribosomal protein L10 [Clostridiales bacterium]